MLKAICAYTDVQYIHPLTYKLVSSQEASGVVSLVGLEDDPEERAVTPHLSLVPGQLLATQPRHLPVFCLGEVRERHVVAAGRLLAADGRDVLF